MGIKIFCFYERPVALEKAEHIVKVTQRVNICGESKIQVSVATRENL